MDQSPVAGDVYKLLHLFVLLGMFLLRAECRVVVAEQPTSIGVCSCVASREHF
jgi:hypothetical protein